MIILSTYYYYYFFVVAGQPIKENLETVDREAVDNLEHVNFDETDYKINKNVDGLGPGVTLNCPPPNVTYNGSLLSSGEVKNFYYYQSPHISKEEINQTTAILIQQI